MIPVLTAADIRKLDQLTTEVQKITSAELMERASIACADWIIHNTDDNHSYIVFSGKGNNGGDGLAIARLLIQAGRKTDVYICSDGQNESKDFIANKSLLASDILHEITGQKSFPEIIDSAIIIDAIFGVGINRPAQGIAGHLIKWINALPNRIISIDMPSGLSPDHDFGKTAPVIRATVTLSFQYMKRSFLLPETGMNAGKVILLDIGLDAQSLDLFSNRHYVIDLTDIKQWIKPRKQFSHKGDFGHALLLGGSLGKCGAVTLASSAALHIGAGRVTARVPLCCTLPLQSSLPEVMVMQDGSADHLSETIKLPDVQAIGAGPGMGTHDATASVLKRIIQDWKGPLILDADALNILAENKTWLSFLNRATILTPHVGEFRRLIGDYADPFERQKAQIAFAVRYNCYVILKGRYTSVACPDGTVLYNPTGNPGMATAGSGDVLTGIITGLLSQGLTPLAAACAGIYLHGLAGDHAMQMHKGNSIIASDIIRFLPFAISQIIND